MSEPAQPVSADDLAINRRHRLDFTRHERLEVELRDALSEEPWTGVAFRFEGPDGRPGEGTLEARLVRTELPPGRCWLQVPDDPRPEPAAVHELRLRLEDPSGRVFAHTRFTLEALGRSYRGRTDGQGRLVKNLPAEATSATLTFEVEEGGVPAEYCFDLELR